ncbi:T9SS type A sorting domain-containing protein [Maribacter sp.]|uniref:T9SS type A sorting domain-containing protein n=1 Tax=Maribacter sp. TaxID=1897614 RepID=UPI0025BECF60|nr:T9SS type A sorting domain-containing protein [Maribacter sp.]
MKTKLLKKPTSSFLTCMLLFSVTFYSYSQQLKKSHDDAPQKGHALYKQSKIYDNKTGPVGIKPRATGDRAMDRWNYEQKMLRNPFTKTIPASIIKLEAEFAKNIKERNLATEATNKSSETALNSKYSKWKNRGPGNVGGRTRALAIDRNNENIIFAGGVSGGLWRSTNQGKTWNKVTKKRHSPSITSIVQDPRQGKGHIWYYASGERFGNSASAGGAFYTGTGIFKSTNNGRSWSNLKNSNDQDLTTITSLDIINSIAVDPKNGELYAATFDGLYKLEKRKRKFSEVLPSARDSQTEVMITPNGKIYATVDIYGAENAGFYTSDDGITWTNITPSEIIPSWGRTVMAYDPSDENKVYFFSHNAAIPTQPFLWKYQANAEAPAGLWEDLSSNLPINIGGRAGNLNLQGAYNMIIKVHPTNPDIVFLGGTNLYRSTTGFTTPTGYEGWIGGYTNLSDSYALYPNHHPDQHNLVFLPSDPNKAISSNDGGVQWTDDITTTEQFVAWNSLNNGYITTQPYAISFDPEGNSDDLLAGFQDNGTWYTNSKDVNIPWIEDFSGDGSYNAIADGGLTRYVSSQFGNLYRLNFDENGEFSTFTRITPAGASNFDFVAPFLLDPINDNVMYMPAGDRIWRNNNLDEIPLFSNAPASVNWVEQNQTATTDGSYITSLDISKFPIASRLYYGTDTGKIYKVDHANLDDQEAVDISTGKGLPEGNINNIYVDPKNPDRVFAVFSNYGIPSLFMTKNAGDSWKNISGNLEENKDGSGNGPSLRWFAMNGKNDGYFVGTSTGLYFTDQIQGKRTYWYKEPIKIGSGVVAQVKTRADGFVAAAIHGNGVYSANYYVRPRPEPRLSVAYLLADQTVAINTESFEIDITDLFVSTKKRAEINIELTNSNPSLISAVLDGNILIMSVLQADTKGKTAIGLIATSGREEVSEGFTVNVIEPAIYQQNDVVSGSSPSQNFIDFGGATAQSADDFYIPEGYSWKIKSIIASGAANSAPSITDATIVFFEDNNGIPGQEIYNSGSITPTSEPDDYTLNLELAEEVTLNSGNYWLSVYTNLEFGSTQQQWFWFTQTNIVGNESIFKDNADLFGTGATDWTPHSLALGGEAEDLVFQIFGNVEDANNTSTPEETMISDIKMTNENLLEVKPNVVTSVWPNPSISSFNFSIIEESKEPVSISVYNLMGQLIYTKSNVDANKPISWDASLCPSGMYVVKIMNTTSTKNFTVVKK